MKYALLGGITMRDFPSDQTTELFNGYIGTMAAVALDELGLFSQFELSGKVSLDSAARSFRADSSMFMAMCEILHSLGYFSIESSPDGPLLVLTPLGADLKSRIGYFVWAVGGYGELLMRMSDVAARKAEYGVDVLRNEEKIAQGAGAGNRQYVFPIVDDLVTSKNVSTFVDIGCGAGELLIRLSLANPSLRAYGIDRSTKACALARKNVENSGLSDRVSIVEADILDLESSAEYAGKEELRSAEMVSCFFMMHDLIPQFKKDGKSIDSFIRPFPSAEHFVIADTMKRDRLPSTSVDGRFFILAFELLHAMMSQEIYTKSYYDELFCFAGLEVESCVDLEIPSSWMYVLSKRRDKLQRERLS